MTFKKLGRTTFFQKISFVFLFNPHGPFFFYDFYDGHLDYPKTKTFLRISPSTSVWHNPPLSLDFFLSFISVPRLKSGQVVNSHVAKGSLKLIDFLPPLSSSGSSFTAFLNLPEPSRAVA